MLALMLSRLFLDALSAFRAQNPLKSRSRAC